MKQSTPYDSARDDIFWRTGVANVDTGTQEFKQLVPKLPIDRTHKISSAGSCFAQHIGHWLLGQNYQYLKSDIANGQVSSFAFGNLYSPRALLQWFTNSEQQLSTHSIWFDARRQKYFDLLLPHNQPDGYSSKEALAEHRAKVIADAKRQLKNSDCFIFTLGLIEAWTDQEDICYPSCPGISVGEFDSGRYQLKVFDYNDLYQDLMQLYDVLKTINPDLQILLTVSPVPLTATATNKHVLLANNYSKSVLRAVVGAFCEAQSDVTYFPSFELITTPLPNDFRFCSNRRTVSNTGVDYVMKHWSGALSADPLEPVQSGHLESVCDEEMLDAVKADKSPGDQPALLTLIGDSHLGKVAKVLAADSVSFCGGMVMNGSGFAERKFVLTSDADIMIPMESADARKLWQPISTNLDMIAAQGLQPNSCIWTNIGLQTHKTSYQFVSWMRKNRPEKLTNIELEDFVEFFDAEMQEQLTIVFRLKELGHRVIVVSDTPFARFFAESKDYARLIEAYMDAMEYVWQQMGVEYFNAPKEFLNEIADPESYKSDFVYDDGHTDWFHGGDKYYQWLTNRLRAISGA